MPFASVKQEHFMWANHPDIARRWAAEYGSFRGRTSSKHRRVLKRLRRNRRG